MSKTNNYHKMKYPVEAIMSIAATGLATSFKTKEGITAKITKNIEMLTQKGIKCDVCGVEGDHFKIRKTSNNALTLFNKNGTTMTIDHHVPKCAGGANKMTNYVPLCNKCNGVWKTQFDQIEGDISKGIIRLTKEDIVE